MRNVVPFRGAFPPAMQIQTLRDIITREVREAVASGIRIKNIAAACDLSQSTVSRLTYGETKRPQLHTIVAVLAYFEYELVALKKN